MKEIVYIPKEYEKTKPRILKGDNARLVQICEDLDRQELKRVGYVKYGVNKATSADAVHVAIDSYFQLQNKGQTTLSIGE